MRVNVVCRNHAADRVLPRFAHYLAAGLGWTVTTEPVEGDVHYLMGYFERQVCPRWPLPGPVASLFTHREEDPGLVAKARLFDEVARQVDLRVSMCRLYAEQLQAIGPTIQPPLPVERGRFTIADKLRRSRPVVGVSGFVAPGGRKGEQLISRCVRDVPGVDWTACGKGWSIRPRRCAWSEMPRFYQGLDVLLCPSLVEGGPMPVLEALSCGVRVVIPRGVGILDELPLTAGIHRYPRGDAAGLAAALKAAAFPEAQVSREALRATTERFTVEAWCSAHAAAFAEAFA